ncbi:Holliday junction resolvase RuvX [Dysosmobacter sp. NSJ-60]|uniref:Putative pre-16S rRNA nuclease n=1 Tax=Pusillibacter faecalis TaxID=2714358 RepID=A0A810QH15_9FIRM|nr:Holliday junction resolvase RuvX [Pusillibacter faecalis]MBC5747805.1 Holliday junction resolvase RuvX [Dysosmobacter hominis]MBS5656830.1 Holliday junction resolvase RuvX [Oscillibacter sp.]MCQ5025779.1 Holliday junction resolvase RuvX [Oscillibacter valericigenes]BCK85126.1 putative pre-16S rRNA nuclease [Pusillibacter faecalis]
MRIMAIDYGDAHTGIAISDPTGFMAGFTTTIDAYRPEAVAERVAALAQEHGVEELVLGHPINMDGTRGPRSEKAQAMKVLLEETSSLPVILWDERRTTIDAHQILLNNGKNAKKRKKVVDAVAASLILEGYLTYKKSHPAG